MKKLIILTVIFTLVFTGCNLFDNDEEKDSSVNAKLRLSNHSSYTLYNVKYTEVNFSDMAVGSNSTMDVSANNPEPIYFELSINNN